VIECLWRVLVNSGHCLTLAVASCSHKLKLLDGTHYESRTEYLWVEHIGV
jgi:hypothetical protein